MQNCGKLRNEDLHIYERVGNMDDEFFDVAFRDAMKYL